MEQNARLRQDAVEQNSRIDEGAVFIILIFLCLFRTGTVCYSCREVIQAAKR